MPDLIVLESPNKVKDVQAYAERLGLKGVRVIATVGHLLDLPPMKEGASVNTETFALERLQPRDQQAGDRVARLKAAIAQATRVIVASDPDREGEAIAAEVWPLVPRDKAYRATFEEITVAGVKRGLDQIRPELADPLVEAALGRRAIDRLAGWYGTALVFDKLRQHKGISAGRLQSAALRLVVERRREHTSFKPSSTFGVRLKLRTISGATVSARLLGDDGKPRVFTSRAEADAVRLAGAFSVAAIEATKSEQRPRPPFQATSWLQVAQKVLGLPVKEASFVLQALFEGGQTTYPRTDSVRVSEDAIAWARSEIARRFGAEYLPPSPWQHKDRGEAVQGAHEAIRPTIPHVPAELEQRRAGQWAEAYGLIEARFLASQAAARVVESTIVRLTGPGGAAAELRGQVELFPGWRRVLATDAEEEPETPVAKDAAADDDDACALPSLKQGEVLECLGTEVVTFTSKPKPLFTQASLVAELKRLGIGRPSTYPSVVPLLLLRGWVIEEAPKGKGKRKGKAELAVLSPTQVGFDLADFLASALPGLVDYGFTAAMEAALDDIEAGKRTRAEVGREWWARFSVELKAAQAMARPARKDLGPCPKCEAEGRQGRLRLIQGTNREAGKPYEFAGCDADTKEAVVCGHTAPTHAGELIRTISCPGCRKPMRPVVRRSGGHSLVCPEHGWMVATEAWELVTPPACPKCSKPMSHHERTNTKGEYFWACFEDKAFLDSDAFGGVSLRGPKRRAPGR